MSRVSPPPHRTPAIIPGTRPELSGSGFSWAWTQWFQELQNTVNSTSQIVGTGSVTKVTGTLPIVVTSPTTTPNVAVNAATPSTLGVVKPDNTTITISSGVLTAVGAGNSADDETVSGSGTSWTLAHTPSPSASLELFVMLAGFGGILLIQGNTPGFTISGANITTTTSYSAGALRAWYRY